MRGALALDTPALVAGSNCKLVGIPVVCLLDLTFLLVRCLRRLALDRWALVTLPEAACEECHYFRWAGCVLLLLYLLSYVFKFRWRLRL